MNSAIYTGTLRHRRFAPTRHFFTYPLFQLYLDLDEVPELFDDFALWSARRPAPAWFRRADYMGPADRPLGDAVRDKAARLTGVRPTGPIRMLTHVRYLGVIMNPVTFYYCFDPAGEAVDLILAEITNTPWGERHTYAIHGDPTTDVVHSFDKGFHVSPFMAMEQRYRWYFSHPGDELSVRMENVEEGEVVFDADLRLRREEVTAGSLARSLARFPWMTARIAASIYWQAARLKLKRTPFHPHPDKRAVA